MSNVTQNIEGDESPTNSANQNPDFEKVKIHNKLKNCLKNYIKKLDETGTSITKEESEKLEVDTFNQYYKPKLVGDADSYKQIPKFYSKIPRQDAVLSQKLREETRAQFLEKKSKQFPDDADLKYLWGVLEKFSPSEASGKNDSMMINYLDYKKIREQAGEKFKPYLTAEVFCRLQAAEGGECKILAVSLFNYIMRRVWLLQTRVGLSLYDVTGQGYLREQDLESYIAELVPSLAALHGLDSSFSSFYVCTAARKFLFFLDPVRGGRVRIQDVLFCTFLDDLLELRVDELAMDFQEANWFSASSALRVYGNYLDLDKDHNGMLSIDELAKYGSGTLTRAFLQRIFQQCLTYDGEMDYKTYLDFVLALENRSEPAALAYLFRVLDIKGQGYLDAFTLNYFFKEIQDKIVSQGSEPVNFEDVKDEIFDMVHPENPTRITLKDLVRCGHGHTVVSILIEVFSFYTYEQRESLVASNEPHSNG